MLGDVGGNREINLEEKERHWRSDRGDRGRQSQIKPERKVNIKNKRKKKREQRREQSRSGCNVNDISAMKFHKGC